MLRSCQPRAAAAVRPRAAPIELLAEVEQRCAGVQVPEIADAAREAFVYAMSRASIVVAIVAALGAFFAWRYLPAREADRHDELDAPATLTAV